MPGPCGHLQSLLCIIVWRLGTGRAGGGVWLRDRVSPECSITCSVNHSERKWLELERGPSGIQRVSLSQVRDMRVPASLGPKALALD